MRNLILVVGMLFSSVAFGSTITVYSNHGLWMSNTNSEPQVFSNMNGTESPFEFGGNAFEYFSGGKAYVWLDASPLNVRTLTISLEDGSLFTGASMFMSNAPWGPGAGINVYADNTFVFGVPCCVSWSGWISFTSDTPFSQIVLTTNEPKPSVFEHMYIDKIWASTGGIPASEVPEPSTMFLSGAGLILLGIMKRK